VSQPVAVTMLTGRSVHRRHRTGFIYSMIELSDGTILTGGYGIKRWTPDYSRCIQIFSHTRSWVGYLTQLDDRTFLSASISGRRTIKRWAIDCVSVPSEERWKEKASRPPRGCCLNTFRSPYSAPCLPVIVLRQHENAIVCSQDEYLSMWRVRDQEYESKPLIFHTPSKLTRLLELDNGTLVSGSRDGCIRFWDLKTSYPAPLCFKAFMNVNCRSIENLIQLDNSNFVSSHEQTLLVWEVNSNSSSSTGDAHTSGTGGQLPSPTMIKCRVLKEYTEKVISLLKRRNGTFLSCDSRNIHGFDAKGSKLEFECRPSRQPQRPNNSDALLERRSDGLISYGDSEVWLWKIHTNRW